MMKTETGPSEETIRLLASPVRLRILALMKREEWAPGEIAEKLEVSLGSVSYHVRTLADAGLLHETRTSLVRGAVQHHYVVAPESASGLRGALDALEFMAKRAKKALR